MQTHEGDVIFERVMAVLHDAVIYRPGGPQYATRDRQGKPLGSKFAGDLIGHTDGYVRKLMSPECPKHEVNIKHLLAWLLGGMDTAPLDEIEAAIGRVAYPVPARNVHGDLSAEALRAAKEFGDVCAVVSQIFDPDSDGGTRVTPRELDRLAREVRELESSLEAMIAAAKDRVGHG